MDAQEVRSRLDHPVVDIDGHIVESIPLVIEYMRRVSGDDVADRFAASVPSFATNRDTSLPAASTEHTPGTFIPPWWSIAPGARDRATAFLSGLAEVAAAAGEGGRGEHERRPVVSREAVTDGDPRRRVRRFSCVDVDRVRVHGHAESSGELDAAQHPQRVVGERV